MPLNRAWIEQHLPHRGRMCLLDEVVHWTRDGIRCRSTSHRLADHPLRAHGRLGIACGIEYAAQAMALHGALFAASSDQPPAAAPPSGAEPLGSDRACSAKTGSEKFGFLASVREVQMFASRLDDVEYDLMCEAVHIAGDARTALYRFDLHAGTGRRLLSGRASVVLAGAHAAS